MDVFLLSGCARLVHFINLCLAFEISDKGPSRSSDGIVDTLDRFI